MANYGIINDRSPHIIADLCELICYLESVTVSRGDVESFINQRGGEGLLQELQADNDAETNERMQRLTEDAFQHLSFRATAFGDWYPFDVNHDVLELKGAFNHRHAVYATLLMDARLKMFSRAVRTRLAAEFESLCYFAIPSMLPSWRVYHFGVGGCDRHMFGNKLKDALPALGQRTRDDMVMARINELPDQNSGDAGIDIVAIYEWADSAQAVPTYFCQCAAQQENWPEKKFESHPITHERYFNFFHKPGAILFIPVCYRGPNGAWIDSDAHQTILVDRLRLIELFKVQIDGGHRTLEELRAITTSPIEPGAFQVVDEEQQAA